MGIPSDYVQNPNAIHVGPVDVSAGENLDPDKRTTKYTANTEMQIPTGEGSTLGGLSNLTESVMAWAETEKWIKKDESGNWTAQDIPSSVKKALIPFPIINNQSGYDAVAKQYMLDNPKQFVTAMDQVGVEVDRAYVKEMAKVAAAVKPIKIASSTLTNDFFAFPRRGI